MTAKVNLITEPNTQSIVMTREFNAPPALVFKAFTDPALIPQWWGPAMFTTVVDKLDAEKGGQWRFIQQDDDGNEWAFNGVFHTINAEEGIVQTFEFEGMPGHVILEAITFEEKDGKTLMTDTSTFQTIEDRDGMLESGMEEGSNDSWRRLEELLATMTPEKA